MFCPGRGDSPLPAFLGYNISIMWIQYLGMPINMILLGCCISIAVMLFVLLKSGGRRLSILFFSLCVIVGLFWLGTNLVANVAVALDNNEMYLLWTKLTLVGPILLPLVLLLFISTFPSNSISLPKPVIVILLLITFIMLVFVPTGYNVESVEIIDAKNLESTFVPGLLYTLFSIYFVLGLIVSFLLLMKKYYGLKANEKIQIKFVLWGVALSALFGVIFSAILPMLGVSNLISISPASIVFFIILCSYAIVKHQLLNVQLIVAETVTYLVLIILFIELFFSSSTGEFIARVAFMIVAGYGGAALIRSMKSEIEQKVKLEFLTIELKKSNKKLKQVDAMKTEFVSMASHELLTPISAIEGYLSMIVDEHLVKIEDPKAQKFLANIYSSSKRLARLVGDLLNVSRIEQGRLLMQKTIVDVDALVNSVITELKFRAQERQMTMTPDFRAQGAQASSFADADKIKEILVNLTGNSIKYTQKGGQIVIAVDLWPTAQVEQRYQAMAVQMKSNGHTGALQRIANEKLTQMVGDHQIVISVADNGIGISPQDIGHLFQKFSRVGDWSTQEVQGTGLGLYISRALVEMHHGKIWAESPGEKKGTIFYFSLPLAQYQQQVLQLDNQVPQSRDAKPLARMGGGPAAKV